MPKNHWQILLVDKNKENYRSTQALLSESKRQSVTLDWASSITTAQETLAEGRHDLILLDYHSSKKVGQQQIFEPTSNSELTPIILLVDQKTDTSRIEFLQPAVTDYLIKEELDTARLERAIHLSIELSRTKAALKASEERYELAAQGANDGLCDWNVKTGEVYLSPRWKRMLGYTETELANNLVEIIRLLHPEDQVKLQEVWLSLKKSQAGNIVFEYRILDRSGVYHWAKARGVVVRDQSGRIIRIVGSQSDITTHRQVEAQLMHQVLHDNLTGLPNRALFMDRLSFAMGRARRRFAPAFAVLILDIDRFKVINDSLGHKVGDLLLKELARRLGKVLRPGDTIARWGGDEFTILLDELTEESSATEIAGRLQKELELPFKLEEQEVYTSASIGVAISSPEYQRPEEILRDADTAMERAKAQGKGHKIVFENSMRAKAKEMLQIENDLRRALERNEFVVHYQPIIDLVSGALTSFEALVRWQHPTRGFIPPNDFIPLAEETGQIVPLGLWVMREACAQLRRWRDTTNMAPFLSMCVNLSVRQLTQPDLVEQIRRVVSDNCLQPGSLKLEITETGVMKDVEGAIIVLNQLRDSGVEFCVDDFGTGHSSLGYLQRLPIKMLKIDRSFVSRLNRTNKDGELVCTIIELARRLGLKVVAEGVETEEQLSILKELQCQYAQGYLFSKPIASDLAEKLLPRFPQRLAG